MISAMAHEVVLGPGVGMDVAELGGDSKDLFFVHAQTDELDVVEEQDDFFGLLTEGVVQVQNFCFAVDGCRQLRSDFSKRKSE